MQVLEINKEILMEKDTLLMGLTVRESLCSCIGLIVTVGGYTVLKSESLGLQGSSWIAILVGVPIFVFGLFRKNGMTLEKYLSIIIRSKFLSPKKRPVSYPNTHYELLINSRGEEGNSNGQDKVSQKRYLLRKQKNRA